MKRRLKSLALIVTLLVGAGLAMGIGQLKAAVISQELLDYMAQADSSELIPIVVVMGEQMELGDLQQIIAGLSKNEARGVAMAELKSLANSTQGELIAYLEEKVSQGKASDILPLWIVNVVGTRAVISVINEIATRPEVSEIALDEPRNPFFFEEGPQDSVYIEIPWGVRKVRAPEVWQTYPDLADVSVVVGVIDTGVDYNHTDLRHQMWINEAEDINNNRTFEPWSEAEGGDYNGIDDDGNGYIDDVIGWNWRDDNPDPMDDYGHGTHVAGTIAGDGTANIQTGVAPGADIMAHKVSMRADTTTERQIWQAMEYCLENGADIISMSLGWHHEWDPRRGLWRRACDATTAMGVVMVICAGNEGRYYNPPDNIRTPGDVPCAVTIGATDSLDMIVEYNPPFIYWGSSKGPVSWEYVGPYYDHPFPPGLLKPDVSGPGLDVLSCKLGGGYCKMSGTSMATPHTSGIAAMMLEADTTLWPEEVKWLLENTSIDFGVTGKDSAYGSGRIDALKAVEATIPPYYDDCGNPSQEAHLLQGTDDEACSPAISVSKHPQEVKYRYTGLGDEQWWVELTYYGVLEDSAIPSGDVYSYQTLDAYDCHGSVHQVHDEISVIVGEVDRYSFRLPLAAYEEDGRLCLSFKKVSGVNAVVSEITVYDSIGTGIPDEPLAGSLPESYSLSQNYPNPFNPTTAISYAVPSTGQLAADGGRPTSVTLKVYNILGQEVRTLVDEKQVPGHYSVSWDGRDSRGKGVSSGIYIYRLDAGGYSSSRKMVLLR